MLIMEIAPCMLRGEKYENSKHRVCIIDGIKISGFDELLSSPGPSQSPSPCPSRPPSRIKVPPKKKDLDLGLTLKSHGPPHHPTTFKHEGVL